MQKTKFVRITKNNAKNIKILAKITGQSEICILENIINGYLKPAHIDENIALHNKLFGIVKSEKLKLSDFTIMCEAIWEFYFLFINQYDLATIHRSTIDQFFYAIREGMGLLGRFVEGENLRNEIADGQLFVRQIELLLKLNNLTVDIDGEELDMKLEYPFSVFLDESKRRYNNKNFNMIDLDIYLELVQNHCNTDSREDWGFMMKPIAKMFANANKHFLECDNKEFEKELKCKKMIVDKACLGIIRRI